MTRFPDPARSRAVLIGAGRYHAGDALPDIPAVRANLADLAVALTEPPTGTLSARRCTVVSDPESADDVGNAITTAATEAADLLLVYYAGHGLVDERGRLHLALCTTDPARPRWTALPFDLLREEIAGSPAATRVLILDCCFSGRAIEAMTGPQNVITGQIDIAGTYTLTSTTANALSYAPTGATHTAFTGALLAVLDNPGPVTLDDLFRGIAGDLAGRGLSRPQRRVVNAAGDLVLFNGSTDRKRPSTVPPKPSPAAAAYQLSVPLWVTMGNVALSLAAFLLQIEILAIGTGALHWSGWVFWLFLLGMALVLTNVNEPRRNVWVTGRGFALFHGPGAGQKVLEWDHVDRVAVAAVTRRGGRHTYARVTVRVVPSTATTIRNKAPFRGFVRSIPGHGHLWTLGDIDKPVDEVRATFRSTAPSRVAVVEGTGAELKHAKPWTGLAILVAVFSTVVVLLALLS